MGFFNWKKLSPAIKVGWLIDANKAGFIWEDPQPLNKEANSTQTINDFSSRFFEVLCPVDLHVSFAKDANNRSMLINKAGGMSTVSSNALNELIFILPDNHWRFPDKPIIQIQTPYRFLSDDVVYLNQFPSFFHYHAITLPGVMMSARIPLHIWPRKLQWTFEWYDAGQDLILKRGDPWFILFFETGDPSKQMTLIDAEMTDELQKYCLGLDNVSKYCRNTSVTFNIAASRRPKKLLQKK